MESYVAVCVELDNKQRRYFLTYGRVFDLVNGNELCEIILKYATHYALGGTPQRAELCYSLFDASDEPYFYESLMLLHEHKCPNDKRKQAKWKSDMKKRMLQGQMLIYCGEPNHRERCRSAFWSMKSQATHADNHETATQ